MKPTPGTAYTITSWPGLFTNTGPSSSGSPIGAASIQTNLQCVRKYGIRTRPGLVPVMFDGESTLPPVPPVPPVPPIVAGNPIGLLMALTYS